MVFAYGVVKSELEYTVLCTEYLEDIEHFCGAYMYHFYIATSLQVLDGVLI